VTPWSEVLAMLVEVLTWDEILKMYGEIEETRGIQRDRADQVD
jgi:hypothetical protein